MYFMIKALKILRPLISQLFVCLCLLTTGCYWLINIPKWLLILFSTISGSFIFMWIFSELLDSCVLILCRNISNDTRHTNSLRGNIYIYTSIYIFLWISKSQMLTLSEIMCTICWTNYKLLQHGIWEFGHLKLRSFGILAFWNI